MDFMGCGIDHDTTAPDGDVEVSKYPWLGVLYYADCFLDGGEDTRAVTPVCLIHRNFVVGSSAEIAPMPKRDFRKNARVLLGQSWASEGWRVHKYYLHPEYTDTANTICLVQLRPFTIIPNIRHLCPPPLILQDPDFHIVKLKEDLRELKKEIFRAIHIPAELCKKYYVAANYSKAMSHLRETCAVTLYSNEACHWDSGALLVTRDWRGRWILLGIGIQGPGCGAPSRFLDMMTYYPWIHHILPRLKRMATAKRYYRRSICFTKHWCRLNMKSLHGLR